MVYSRNLIHLEASHALSDGTGAIYFLQAIGYRYVQLAYKCKLPYEQGNKRYGLAHGINVTDGYAQNCKKVKRSEHRQPQAYMIKGNRRSIADMRIISATMSAQELKTVSNEYHATITEYLSAVILMTVRDSYSDIGKKTIRIELPVDWQW